MAATQASGQIVSNEFRARCEELVRALNLGNGATINRIEALPGGVSSDIALVWVGTRRICVKCALDQLRVDAPWFVPIRRNQAEYRWLQFATSVTPQAVPLLYGISESAGAFAMQYIEPDQAWNYKAELLAGRTDDGQARQIGDVLGRIHAASTQPDFDATGFDNAADFHALRLEPYLQYTALQHPGLATTLNELVENYANAKIALVHGDVSPKNTLIGAAGPILLDAECASIGDPAFDIAFFANHLLLKAVHMPKQTSMLVGAMLGFVDSYREHISWEAADPLLARAAKLLPALMLARVDGKSPAEYLTVSSADAVRQIALTTLTQPAPTFQSIAAHVSSRSTP